MKQDSPSNLSHELSFFWMNFHFLTPLLKFLKMLATHFDFASRITREMRNFKNYSIYYLFVDFLRILHFAKVNKYYQINLIKHIELPFNYFNQKYH